jgi:hypothetical protein
MYGFCIVPLAAVGVQHAGPVYATGEIVIIEETEKPIHPPLTMDTSRKHRHEGVVEVTLANGRHVFENLPVYPAEGY